MTTSPRLGNRGSARTKFSSSWCARRSARPRGSTKTPSPRSRPRREGTAMRLAILDSGHGFGTKALFALIRMASRQPVLDVIKLVKYRPDFYGTPMGVVTQEAMRGPSAWSVGDRELMAAIVAKTSGCEWCTKAHSAVAKGAYRDAAKVSAVLSDLETAPIEEPLRATLRLL